MAKNKKRSATGNADVFARHQMAIARQTLRMPDAMVGVMGGMDKAQAREILKRSRRNA